MRSLTVAATALCVLAVPAAANAALVSIQNIGGAWSNNVPVAGIAINNGNPDQPTARWGTPVQGGNQSGYSFNATNGAINTVLPPSPSPDFVLGTFTHLNNPITGTSLDSIVLTVMARIFIDGADQGLRNFVFDFNHDETNNEANPCAYGGANQQGVNVNGCADRVTVNFNNLSQNFVVGSDTYTLNIRGFERNGTVTSDFLTVEAMNNTANLVGFLTLRSPPEQVPEPMSLVLFGMALAGFGMAQRRRAA